MTVELPAELVAALERHIARQRPNPSKTAVIRIAIEDYLAGKGDWPAEDDDPPRGKRKP